MAPMRGERESKLLLYSMQFISLLALIEAKEPQERKFWVRKIFRERCKHGLSSSLVPELRAYDRTFFFQFLRMPVHLFDLLLRKVAPGISKQTTRWREPISSHDRLCVTLRFLATGETLRSLSFQFRMGRTTLTNIIRETCNEIFIQLKEKYVKAPETEEAWKRIASDFAYKWQLPHCCGAIDGKHVKIVSPPKSGTLNYCYKGYFSKVLLAVADAHYRFTLFDFGFGGSDSDGCILSKSFIGNNLQNNLFHFPQPTKLPLSETVCPYFFIGDEAFPLRHNLMRPYPRRVSMNEQQKVYNYRICRARRVVENAFGILASRFRLFFRPLNYDSDRTLPFIIAATISLHNFLLTESGRTYCPAGYADEEDLNHNVIPGQWREERVNFENLYRQASNTYPRVVKDLREKLAHYLNSEGSVSWQHNHI